jgi:hypothetical protein
LQDQIFEIFLFAKVIIFTKLAKHLQNAGFFLFGNVAKLQKLPKIASSFQDIEKSFHD